MLFYLVTGAWLSWLERLIYIQQVRGSSPLAPTIIYISGQLMDSKGASADLMGGKASTTIVVRGVSERRADPSSTVGERGRQIPLPAPT